MTKEKVNVAVFIFNQTKGGKTNHECKYLNYLNIIKYFPLI
jgi:hypothetical protein